MRYLLPLLFAVTLYAQAPKVDPNITMSALPARIKIAAADDTHDILTFSDTVVLVQESFWDGLFHRDVRYELKFSQAPHFTVYRKVKGTKGFETLTMTNAEYKGTIEGVAGCYGKQKDLLNQRPFTFDNRSDKGLLIRGTGAEPMTIFFTCSILAANHNPPPVPQKEPPPPDCKKTPEACSHVIIGAKP